MNTNFSDITISNSNLVDILYGVQFYLLFDVNGYAIKTYKYWHELMLHAMNLMFLNKRSHQAITEEEMRFQIYSTTKKGNATTTFFKPLKRKTSES